MDRFGAVTTWDDEDEGGHRLRVDVSYPSRRTVIPAIKEALEGGTGPVVLTGEPGSGKTWLSKTVLAELPENYRGLKIDLTPAVGPLGFHRLILARLGIDPSTHRDVASARHAIESALTDDFDTGRRTILVVEEAHNATDAVFEELRATLNHRGHPEGFWGMLLIGQTPLARRLHSRVLAGFSARIGGRIHLRAFDVVELAESIRLQAPQPNPEALPEAVDQARVQEQVETASRVPQAEPQTPSDSRPTWEPPPIAITRPPLHEADGMIEVGWEAPADSGDDNEAGFAVNGAPTHAADDEALDGDEDSPVETHLSEIEASFDDDDDDLEEPIHDHYTGLQAWNEWSKNHPTGRVGASRPDAASEPTPDASESAIPAEGGTFWAEGRQEFAPYSQLFSRLKKGTSIE